MRKTLSPKQRRFVVEYLVDQNGTQAAIRAGYSAKTAQQQASRLLSKALVKKAFAAKAKLLEDASIMTAREVLQAQSRIARCDVRQLMHPDGTIKPTNEWPDDAALAVAGVDIDELFAGTGRDRMQIGETRNLKLWSKDKALEFMGKHYRLVTDKIEVTIKEGLSERIKKARERVK